MSRPVGPDGADNVWTPSTPSRSNTPQSWPTGQQAPRTESTSKQQWAQHSPAPSQPALRPSAPGATHLAGTDRRSWTLALAMFALAVLLFAFAIWDRPVAAPDLLVEPTATVTVTVTVEAGS